MNLSFFDIVKYSKSNQNTDLIVFSEDHMKDNDELLIYLKTINPFYTKKSNARILAVKQLDNSVSFYQALTFLNIISVIPLEKKNKTEEVIDNDIKIINNFIIQSLKSYNIKNVNLINHIRFKIFFYERTGLVLENAWTMGIPVSKGILDENLMLFDMAPYTKHLIFIDEELNECMEDEVLE